MTRILVGSWGTRRLGKKFLKIEAMDRGLQVCNRGTRSQNSSIRLVQKENFERQVMKKWSMVLVS